MSDPLLSVSPVDGRYRTLVSCLSDICSEFALIKYRLYVEAKYIELLKSVLGHRSGLTDEDVAFMKEVYSSFSPEEARRIKELESRSGHDVVALVQYVKENTGGRKRLSSMIHFGLTSDDVNNIAYSLMLRDVIEVCYLPALKELIERLLQMAGESKGLAMLGHTHGQKASPTTLGKELATYAYRLSRLALSIAAAKLPGKLNGATGNYNALRAAYPDVNWLDASAGFIRSLGLEPEPYTTQVLPHEGISQLLWQMAILSALLQNLDVDMWLYCALGYLTVKKQSIGSTTMPHKSNPIEFENSEGNSKLSITLLTSLSTQLIISRMQRDLSDSTIKRNYCGAIAYSLLAIKATTEGLRVIEPDTEEIRRDLASHAEVLGEAVQHVLRREGKEEGFEVMVGLLKGRKLTTEELWDLLEEAGLAGFKMYLPSSPGSYIGLAEELATRAIADTRRNLEKLDEGRAFKAFPPS